MIRASAMSKMKTMEWRNGNFILTDDAEQVDIDAVHQMLKNTYWASKRTRGTVEKTVANSMCFSLLSGDRQIGFTRVVSDFATVSYIADVIIHPEFRGRGLGTWMMKCIIEHPDVKNTQRLLQTIDAHEFYKKNGFAVCEGMNIRPRTS